MIDALDMLGEYRDMLVFTHQTGHDDYLYVKTHYEKTQFQAEVFEYIHDIPRMYARSHLIICRAGANTVAELTVSRRPAILIPYPHGDGHQEQNAYALKEAGTAQVILQHDLSGKTLANAVISFVNHPEEFAQVWMTPHFSETGTAAEKVVDLCLRLAQRDAAGA